MRDVHWIADHGLRGGVLLPGVPPGAPIPPLHARAVRPGVARVRGARRDRERARRQQLTRLRRAPGVAVDVARWRRPWFSHRPLWTFILAGVFDRFPALRLVLAEQGSGWIRDALDVMDNFYAQIAQGNVGVMRFVEPQLLERMPSEYWHDNCMVAASFLHRDDCARRDRIGVDHIMWGSRLPAPRGHDAVLARGDPDDLRRRARGRGAGDARRRTPPRSTASTSTSSHPLAEQFGPRVDDVMAGLDAVPEGAAQHGVPRARARERLTTRGGWP